MYDQNFYGVAGLRGGNSERCLKRGGHLQQNYLRGGRGKARHCLQVGEGLQERVTTPTPCTLTEKL